MILDLRKIPFNKRAEISDQELTKLADADVPGAETELTLRWSLIMHNVEREKVEPECAP